MRIYLQKIVNVVASQNLQMGYFTMLLRKECREGVESDCMGHLHGCLVCSPDGINGNDYREARL